MPCSRDLASAYQSPLGSRRHSTTKDGAKSPGQTSSMSDRLWPCLLSGTSRSIEEQSYPRTTRFRHFVAWISIELYTLRASATSTGPSTAVRLFGLTCWRRKFFSCFRTERLVPSRLSSSLISRISVATIQPTSVIVPEFCVEGSSDRLLGSSSRDRGL
jgi:hypothetical protein